MTDPQKPADPLALSDSASEQQIIGGLIVEPRLWPKVAGIVNGSHFVNATWGRLFNGVLSLAQAGENITDLAYLVPRLREIGLDSAEALRIVNQSGFAAHVTYHAERIKRLYNLRQMFDLCGKFAAEISPNSDDAEIATAIKARLESLAAGGANQAEDFTEVADRVITRLRQPKEQASGRSVMTGIYKLDEMTGGMRPGELVILAARPGIGKTALAMQVVEHNSQKNRACLFVSLEMTSEELVTRTLAAHAGVNSNTIRRGELEAGNIDRLGDAADALRGEPIQIWAPSKAKLIGIEAMARITAMKAPLALLVVDYIGLVQADNKRDERHIQVAAITQGLKQLAKELKIPVLALCQLNREADKEVPRLSHLRESGSIEQDADMVWFIHSPDGPAKATGDTRNANIIVAKHRHGSVGRIELEFNGAKTRFEVNNEWRP